MNTIQMVELTHRRLTDGYWNSRRLSDAYGHTLKKKINLVIFGRFKIKNPRAVGSNRQILDRNVVVPLAHFITNLAGPWS